MFRGAEARTEFEAARDADPTYPGVHSGLGQVYWKEGKIELATREFEAELKSRPDDPVSKCLLGEVLQKVNDRAATLRNFRGTVAANPKHTEAQFDWEKQSSLGSARRCQRNA